MVKPIFVVGSPRSGTTWLANVLCRHHQIAGVQAEPFGIRESAYFSHIEGFFGNLKDDNNFIQFIETFGSSDYFRFTGINKNLFYERRPKTYVQAFLLLMNTFAKNSGANFWLEKSPGHTLYIRKISKYFKDAKFIGIKRNAIDMVRSSVKRTIIRNKFIKKIYIIKRIFRQTKYEKYLDRFSHHSDRIINVSYESLKSTPENEIKKLCEFLEIEYYPELLNEHYKPNTSFSNFSNKKEREEIITPFEVKLIKWVSYIFNIFPYLFYRVYYFFQINIRDKSFPPWYWIYFIREKLQKS